MFHCGRTYGRTDILPGLVGHLSRDDLKIVKRLLSAQQLDIKHIVHIQCLRQMQGRRQVKKCGVDTHGERAQRAYNGGFGAESPAGSRGRSLVREMAGGAKPHEAENLVGKFQDGHFELNVRKRRASQAPNRDRHNPLLPSKNSPDLHQSQERPVAKVG